MHELGVVFHIIKQVEDIARANNVKRVIRVTLEEGEVSGLVPYYVEDCWNWAVKKSEILQGCKVVQETLKAYSFCTDCKKEYPTVEYGKTCPYCGSGNTYLIRGNGVIIKDIAVPTEEVENPSEKDNCCCKNNENKDHECCHKKDENSEDCSCEKDTCSCDKKCCEEKESSNG